MSDNLVDDLTDAIVPFLTTMHPPDAPSRGRARRIAVDIANRYHLIPAAECEPIVQEYALPAELVADAAFVEEAHAVAVASAVEEASRRGLLVVTPPIRYDMPPFAHDPWNLRRFRVTATGWRPGPAAPGIPYPVDPTVYRPLDNPTEETPPA